MTAPKSAPDLETFFAGVDELRGYLDRHIHDPSRRRARLARIARDLLKPRGPRALAWWLGSQIQEALGSAACSVWVKDGSWAPWYRSGVSGSELPPELLAGMVGVEPVPSASGIAVPIPGLSGPVGVLWIAGEPEVQEGVGDLLTAIAGAAGMALDQALRVAALSRDPVTGLLFEQGLVEQLGPELRSAPPPGRCAVLLALRLPVSGSAGDARLRLARAARERVPPGSPMSVDVSPAGVELLAAPPAQPIATCAGEVRSLAESIAAACGGAPWRAAYHAADRPVDDVAGIIEQLRAALDRAGERELTRLEGS